jgi:antitoxin (DNA-binding transcriptional repressor) of toxin-antitoxin stability system
MVMSTIDEAQSQLTRLIGLAEKGEEIVIAREGKPVVRLVAFRQADGPRRGGQWHGQVHIAPDFDELPPSLGEAFGLPVK